MGSCMYAGIASDLSTCNIAYQQNEAVIKSELAGCMMKTGMLSYCTAEHIFIQQAVCEQR